ncbi:hypothetical protein WICPIJ_005345 [Wickerhamomyces pijperi]|uniref:Uncharacterized protein n=1 Tax=Wickerhamomyces pijperi TaxID=599730 RepID=A0A9P8TMF4_WICPI|nr:hypothetical protein WICPIJ_005345 [Wickerhamomyces pijperi]
MVKSLSFMAARSNSIRKDFSSNSHTLQRCVFDGRSDFLGQVLIIGVFWVQVHSGGWSLHVLSNVQDFLQTRNTGGNLLGSNTGKMESIQCHLGSWLTNRLRSDNTNHFTWVDNSSLELGFNFTQDPQLVVFFVQQTLQLKVTNDITAGFQESWVELVEVVDQVNTVSSFESTVFTRKRVDGLFFNVTSIKTIFTVNELDNVTKRVSGSTIIMDHDVFQGLNQTTLDITSLGSLDGMWQSTISETESNTLTFNRLLTNTSRHLGNVNEGTLGTSTNHLFDIVQPLQVDFGGTTSLISSLVQETNDVIFKGFSQSHTMLGSKLVLLGFNSCFFHLDLGCGNGFGNFLHGVGIGNGVTNTNRETVVKQPEVNHLLNVTEQLGTGFWALFSHDNVDQTTIRGTNSLLVDNTEHDLTINDQHTIILWR